MTDDSLNAVRSDYYRGTIDADPNLGYDQLDFETYMTLLHSVQECAVVLDAELPPLELVWEE
jgi:hypothetical protein